MTEHNKNDNSYIRRWSMKIRAINMLGGKCLKCGNSDVQVLTFHHCDTNNKENVVTNLINCNYGWYKVKEEALKCELLCANCHREFHQDDRCINGNDLRGREFKKQILSFKGTDRCESCGHKGRNNASLQFHHTKKKNFEITQEIMRRKGIFEHILKEIDNCMVLCSNCHLKETIKQNKFIRLKIYIYKRVNEFWEAKAVDKDKIIKLYKQGIKKIDIANIVMCSKSTVTEVTKKYDEEKK